MAWRPTTYLEGGELDNTQLGRVKGWFRLAGVDKRFEVDLEGDFSKEIRGRKIRIVGQGQKDREAPMFVRGMASRQTGKVGCIRLVPSWRKGKKYLYIEWYSDTNGRVVIEFEPVEVRALGAADAVINGDAREQDGKCIVIYKGSAVEAW